jgi:hypothetical protein
MREFKYHIHPREVATLSLDEALRRNLRKVELEQNYDNHDCHLSPEDGCVVHAAYMDMKAEEASLHAEGYQTDPELQRYAG